MEPLNRLERAWVLYDVGNSAFVLMTSTIIPIFFKNLAASAGISDADFYRLLELCRRPLQR